jgi:ethanolamine utilization protein EutQ (cupin superfamily)
MSNAVSMELPETQYNKSAAQELLEKLIESKRSVTCVMVSPRGPFACVQGHVTVNEYADIPEYTVTDGCSYIVFTLANSYVRYDTSKGRIVIRIE